MRRLLPTARDEDLAAVYDDLVLVGPVGDRCGISLGMVSSLDGAVAIEGRTAALGRAADKAAFVALRGAADAILVGAGTVRAENYGPGAGSAAARRRRPAKGLAPSPRLVIVTNRPEFDPEARAFADPDHPPLVVTNARAAAATPGVTDRAEVLPCGDDRVELTVALQQLATRGLFRVLCEGGPTLNAALFADRLVDEVFLTISNTLAGGSADRIVAPPAADANHVPAPARLVELREHADELLLRYRILPPAPADRL